MTRATGKIKRNVQFPGYGSGNFHRLIKSALSVSGPVQRHRHEAVGQLRIPLQILGQQRAEQTGIGVVRIKFQRRNQMRHGALVDERSIDFIVGGTAAQTAPAQRSAGGGRVQDLGTEAAAMIVSGQQPVTAITKVTGSKALAAA